MASVPFSSHPQIFSLLFCAFKEKKNYTHRLIEEISENTKDSKKQI